MLANHRFVRSEIYAVNLVAGHVAVQPLNVVAQAANRSHGSHRDFTDLCVGELSDTWCVAFDDEFRHGETVPDKGVLACLMLPRAPGNLQLAIPSRHNVTPKRGAMRRAIRLLAPLG